MNVVIEYIKLFDWYKVSSHRCSAADGLISQLALCNLVYSVLDSYSFTVVVFVLLIYYSNFHQQNLYRFSIHENEVTNSNRYVKHQ